MSRLARIKAMRAEAEAAASAQLAAAEATYAAKRVAALRDRRLAVREGPEWEAACSAVWELIWRHPEAEQVYNDICAGRTLGEIEATLADLRAEFAKQEAEAAAEKAAEEPQEAAEEPNAPEEAQEATEPENGPEEATEPRVPTPAEVARRMEAVRPAALRRPQAMHEKQNKIRPDRRPRVSGSGRTV